MGKGSMGAWSNEVLGHFALEERSGELVVLAASSVQKDDGVSVRVARLGLNNVDVGSHGETVTCVSWTGAWDDSG